MTAATLTGFAASRPRFEVSQQRALDLLVDAHADAEASRRGLDDAARASFAAQLARTLRRVACSPEKIGHRGLSITDLAQDWTTAARMRAFRDIVDEYFETAYSADHTPPDDLIHVTCTGYVSPSGAQRLVARRGWGDRTRVTHAYHMGCCAAIPALRIAGGMLATGSHQVDIVHTELCTLHLDPADHALAQLVVHSLFGDGLIRYSIVPEGAAEAGLRVLAVHEQLLPDSGDAMSWIVGDHGMQMTLARDVPLRVGASVRGFIVELFRRAGVELAASRGAAFAIHPGGPKIIDEIGRVLELDEPQLAASRGVLFDHGNMSSATLPHVWMRVLADPRVPRGTLVPSLAFGPGLTMCGALLEKR